MRGLLAALLLAATPALAVLPSEVLDDPVLEARARSLSQELRCLVCRNENIDESGAELAQELRVLVRERLLLGATDADVLDYLVARYGEFVLLNPRGGGSNAILWGAPLALLLLGGGIAAVAVTRGRAEAVGLSPAEEARLAELMGEGRDGTLSPGEPRA